MEPIPNWDESKVLEAADERVHVVGVDEGEFIISFVPSAQATGKLMDELNHADSRGVVFHTITRPMAML